MERREQDDNQYMAQALLSHAKEIRRYARTFCEATSANQALDEGQKRKFAKTVDRMVNEMHALMLMAGYKGVAALCNREQIEAYMDEARLAISKPFEVRQSAAIFN
jgi:hypothetical protein